jgi:hypothetical protein
MASNPAFLFFFFFFFVFFVWFYLIIGLFNLLRIWKRGESQGGAGLQLQDGRQRVRRQAHAGAGRRVAE